MQNQVKVVQFHDQTLTVIPQQNKLLVAIKPICENLGIQWHAQRKRIHRDDVLNSTASMMDSVAKDGKTRELLCLPLEFLNGWLFGIDTSRIKNLQIKERVLQYKRECYQVLHDYWTKGQATNPRQPAAKNAQLTTEQQTIIKEMVKARVEVLPPNKKAKAAITCWSALKSKFGCTYKEIHTSLFTDAVSLVARLPLEGTLLPKDEPNKKPQLALEINYPVERWQELSPWLKNQLPQAAGMFNVTANMLYGPDANTPISHLLKHLASHGHNVQACQIELMAMQHHLEKSLNTLGNLSRLAGSVPSTALAFKIN